MTPDVSRWRSTEQYDYIEDLVSPELAWEWLRRNEAYQRDYVEIINTTDPPETLIATTQQRWGLRFPHPADAGRQAGRDLLDAEGRYRRRHPDRRAGRPPIRHRRSAG